MRNLLLVLFLALTPTFASCPSNPEDPRSHAEQTADTLYGVAGGLRAAADMEPDEKASQFFKDAANALNVMGRAVVAGGLYTRDEATGLDKVEAVVFALQQIQQYMETVKPGKAERWRPYVQAAVITLATVRAQYPQPNTPSE